MKKKEEGTNLACSFCGKSQKEVKKLIAGPTVYICDECIELCNDIIAGRGQPGQRARQLLRPEAPRDQVVSLDQYVVGQETAKKNPLGGRAQPLPAHRNQSVVGRRRATESEHPPARPTAAARRCSRRTLAKINRVPFTSPTRPR